MTVPLNLCCPFSPQRSSVLPACAYILGVGLASSLEDCSYIVRVFSLGSGVASPGAPFVLSNLKAQGRLLLCFAILSRPALPSMCPHDAAAGLGPPIWLLP